MFVLLSLAAVAVAGLLWARWRARKRAGETGQADETGRVVLQVFGEAWAERFGTSAKELAAAFFTPDDAALRCRVDREVGVVDLRFDGGGRRAAVATTIILTYASDEQRTTAHLALPWDEVPSTVRAELLRGDGESVFRKWRAIA